MVKKVDESFSKHCSTMLQAFNTLEQRASPYKRYDDIFGNNRIILVAVTLQNILHPKNHNRTEAIANKSYVEIKNEEQAVSFLNEQLQHNLNIALLAEETKIISKLQAEA